MPNNEPTIRRNALLEAAFIWQNEGVSVVPAQPKSKAVLYPWRTLEEKPPSDQQIYNWFRSDQPNIAVVCGSGGLLVLDFDRPGAFYEWRSLAGQLAETYIETSGRGFHVFFKVDQPITRRFANCEALGLGHLCNVWPSIHPSGAQYEHFGDPLTPILATTTKELFFLLSDDTHPGITQDDVELVRKKYPAPSRKELANLAKSDVVHAIKAAFPLLQYAQGLTELKPGPGDFWRGKCPLHDDQWPSFWVNGKKGVWGCFAESCPGHRGGDVINLFSLLHDVDIVSAIREMQREANR